jgi:hypothetical protein
MRVGWLVPAMTVAGMTGGAELTQQEFRPPHPITSRSSTAGPARSKGLRPVRRPELRAVRRRRHRQGHWKPTIKYWHDVGPHLQPGVHGRLEPARHICCSPDPGRVHGPRRRDVIPPPGRSRRFEQRRRRSMNGGRSGAVSVGSWRNYGKAAHKAAEWASERRHRLLRGGRVRPQGLREASLRRDACAARPVRDVRVLPIVIEPFGRLVAEAWAAGCEIVTNNLVGAKWWITENPDALYTAGEDFWKTVLA